MTVSVSGGSEMIRYIDELDLAGKKVLMRVDFNVPLNEALEITDDHRIRAALPSVRYALEKGARLILCSHMGKPKGQRVEKLSLMPVAVRLSELLGVQVPLLSDCIGPEVEAAVEVLQPGQAVLLENLRFHSGETKNDPEFSKALASLAEVYVNDAFAVSHRAHASVHGVLAFFKICAAGFLLKKELEYFDRALQAPERPVVAILGGSKVSTKLGAIQNILPKVNKIIIGGAMANTFWAAQGVSMGSSLVEPDLFETARYLISEAKQTGVKFYLPVDVVIAQELKADAVTRIVPVQEIPDGWMALDIGPASIKLFCETLEDVKTIVWNGPVGAFEIAPFSSGTMALAHAVGSSKALSIVGGGDTDAAVSQAGETENISYISTGGGAFLELLEGKELPGIQALKQCV
jgi:phosphoglycerate kinase